MTVLLGFVFWLCAWLQCRNVCVCVSRQGEGADRAPPAPPHTPPTKSDRCNDPTSADLICGGCITDPVTLPSATCAPFKFPAAVNGEEGKSAASFSARTESDCLFFFIFLFFFGNEGVAGQRGFGSTGYIPIPRSWTQGRRCFTFDWN